MSQSSGWSCKSSWSQVGVLSGLLSELKLDTPSSASSCLFISSRSCRVSQGSFGLGGTSFLAVFSGISMGITWTINYFLETNTNWNKLYLPPCLIYSSQFLVTSNLPDESTETAVGAIVIYRPNKDPLKTKYGVVVIHYKWFVTLTCYSILHSKDPPF